MAAVNVDGTVSPDHYWWLAYEWENLLPCCPECGHLKGSRFPVVGKRANAPSRGAALDEEGPLLLDPRRDDPQSEFVFLDDGGIVSKSERGRVTIEVLGLNRRQLLLDRAADLTHAYAEWMALADRGELTIPAVSALTDASRPFAAMRRQFVTTWLADRGVPFSLPNEEVAAVSSEEQATLKGRYDARKEIQESYSVVNPAADYFISTRLIERVVIENVRLITRLELMVPPATTLQAPWLMLLGENGTGKSSVLQAVALALVGDGYRDRLRVNPADYLRHGTRSGFIEVYLTSSPEPIRLKITKDAFKSNTPEPKVLLLGYGATRLLPRAGMQVRELSSEVARVENLFDPFCPLGNADEWLLELPQPAFESAARALKGILDLEPEADLRRNRRLRRIEVDAYGHRVPLGHLSDGYQSVLGLAVDVMSVMFHNWQSMEVAEGIVAIDELGAHLHPRWRMQIVNSLRQVFPRVQFLASTHDPLCLRGLLDGEVTVLRRMPEGGVFTVTDLPPINGLRVDQILTSEVFGLNSTIDPALDALFARYYELKGKWTRTRPEEQELTNLHGRLDRYEVLGQTARERLMLEAADDFLAKERREAGTQKRRELRDSTKRRMAQLWADTKPLKPPPQR